MNRFLTALVCLTMMTLSACSGVVDTEGVEEVVLSTLKKGSKGDSVKALQILLIGNGYSCGTYGADGSFGSATSDAVRKYQKDRGLVEDGIVGPATWRKLLGV